MILRVSSFNILSPLFVNISDYHPNVHSFLDWNYRLIKIKNTIDWLRFNNDIVFLQEMSNLTLSIVSVNIDWDIYFIPNSESYWIDSLVCQGVGKVFHGSVVMIRKGILPRYTIQSLPLGLYGNNCICIDIDNNLSIYGVHLDDNECGRLQELATLDQYLLNNKNENQIIAGDFNTNIMHRSGEANDIITYVFTNDGDQCIDHIIYRGKELFKMSYSIILIPCDMEFGSLVIFGSDHYPISAAFNYFS